MVQIRFGPVHIMIICQVNDNLPGYNIHTTKKNAEAMFFAGKETVSK